LQLVAEKTLLHLVFIGADDIVCGGANIAMSLSWCIYYVCMCVCMWVSWCVAKPTMKNFYLCHYLSTLTT